mgnify:CR=1 FL=1
MGTAFWRVHLAGHLAFYHAGGEAWFTVEAALETRPADLLRRLGVPGAEVAVILVNGRLSAPDGDFLAPGDQVEFFPPGAGG